MLTILVAVGSVFLGLALLGLGASGLMVYVGRQNSTQAAPGLAMEARVAALEIQVKGLPSLWEEERKRAQRSADSARKSRDLADEKLAELQELAEAGDGVRGIDEDGGHQEGMQHVFPRLGAPADPGIHDRAAAVAHLLR